MPQTIYDFENHFQDKFCTPVVLRWQRSRADGEVQWTSNSALLPAPQTRIEGITQSVSQKIKAKHREADSEAWKDDEPRRDFDVLLTSDR